MDLDWHERVVDATSKDIYTNNNTLSALKVVDGKGQLRDYVGVGVRDGPRYTQTDATDTLDRCLAADFSVTTALVRKELVAVTATLQCLFPK